MKASMVRNSSNKLTVALKEETDRVNFVTAEALTLTLTPILILIPTLTLTLRQGRSQARSDARNYLQNRFSKFAEERDKLRKKLFLNLTDPYHTVYSNPS